MGYVIPAGYARVNFEYAAASTLGSSIVTGIGVNTPPGEILLDLFEQWWDESLKLRTSHYYTLLKIEARNDVEFAERTIGQAGALVGDPAPPNTSALFRMQSGLVGRKYRGRMYLPGVLDDDEINADGTIVDTALTSLGGVMAYLIDVLGTASVEPVILHSDSTVPTLVTSGAIQPVVASQRRRLRA